jgi:dCTP deaminase
MAFLSDTQIRKHCQESKLVEDYVDEFIGPCSIDVRLGAEIMVETPRSPNLERVSIAGTTKESPYLLVPQQFILAHTVELFNIPDTLCAFFALKSSRGREGISHVLAGFCDAGWNNSRLTLELHSVRQYHSIPIWHGMSIGQMIFGDMSKPPEKSYSLVGRYNNCPTVEPSKG